MATLDNAHKAANEGGKGFYLGLVVVTESVPSCYYHASSGVNCDEHFSMQYDTGRL